MFSVFAGLSLGTTAAKHVAEYRLNDPTRAKRLAVLSLRIAAFSAGSLSATIMIGAGPIAQHLLDAPSLVDPLRISGVMLFAGAMAGAHAGIHAGFESFAASSRNNLLFGFVSALMALAGAAAWGIAGAVGGMALASCFLWMLHARTTRSLLGERTPFSVERSDLLPLWRFSLPALLANALYAPTNWAVAKLLVDATGGFEALGIYNAANQWFAAVIFLPSMLGQVLLPIMAERRGAADATGTRRLLLSATKIYGLAGVLAFLLIAGASPLLMALYGEVYANSWPTLVVCVATASLLAVHTPSAQFQAASGRMWAAGWMNFGWAVTFLGLTWMLTGYGAFGVSVARLVAYILHSAWTIAYAWRLSRSST